MYVNNVPNISTYAVFNNANDAYYRSPFPHASVKTRVYCQAPEAPLMGYANRTWAIYAHLSGYPKLIQT